MSRRHPTETRAPQLPVALPAALNALLVQVRTGLKAAGDDGSHGSTTRVTVKMGWPEIRAVYALYTSVRKAREQRDLWKKRCDGFTRQPEISRDVAQLLADVEHLLTGTESDSDFALHSTLDQIRALRRRARG